MDATMTFLASRMIWLCKEVWERYAVTKEKGEWKLGEVVKGQFKEWFLMPPDSIPNLPDGVTIDHNEVTITDGTNRWCFLLEYVFSMTESLRSVSPCPMLSKARFGRDDNGLYANYPEPKASIKNEKLKIKSEKLKVKPKTPKPNKTMATKTIDHMDFYVAIKPYKTEGNGDQTFDSLRVSVGYNKGRGFYVSYHPGWGDGSMWGCVFDFSKNPLTAGGSIGVEPATKNNSKRIEQMHSNLEIAKLDIAWLFNERKFEQMQQLMKDVALYGYTASIEERMKGYKNVATVKAQVEAGQKAETPMMKQYREIKAKHPDTVLLFRCGDFYETYENDAVICAKVLGITLTKSSAGYQMAGFPHHALDTYLPKLIRANYRVAICDQLEDPKLTKQVKRGITELVIPTNQTNENETPNNNQNNSNTMEANNMKAADLIGKTIIVGENIATITIKSADGETLQGEFKKACATIGMPLPITMENLRQQIASGAWHIAEVKSEKGKVKNESPTPDPSRNGGEKEAQKPRVQPKPAQEIEEEDSLTPDPSPKGDGSDADEEPSDEAPNDQTTNSPDDQADDDPVLKQWKEAKAQDPDAIIIFRNGSVYVAVGEDAEKLAEVAELKTAQHNGTAICVFPGGDLSAVMMKAVGAGLRVKMEDLQQPKAEEAATQAQPTEKPKVKPKAAEEEPADDSPTEEEEMVNGQSSMVNGQSSMFNDKKPKPSDCTAEPEAGKPRIIDYGKSIVVAGDTTKIEAVLLTLWGRKRPYTHKGKTYSGIQLSAKHKATVQEIIKLAS